LSTWPSRLIPPRAPAGALHLREEARRVLAACELGRAEDVEREPARRRHAVEPDFLERADPRAIAAGRSSAQTISFAISES
jgi:hypothetical protein